MAQVRLGSIDARLNAYALARPNGQSLLFKGDDLARADIYTGHAPRAEIAA
jgi:uncharacterized protein with PIN domain